MWSAIGLYLSNATKPACSKWWSPVRASVMARSRMTTKERPSFLGSAVDVVIVVLGEIAGKPLGDTDHRSQSLGQAAFGFYLDWFNPNDGSFGKNRSGLQLDETTLHFALIGYGYTSSSDYIAVRQGLRGAGRLDVGPHRDSAPVAFPAPSRSRLCSAIVARLRRVARDGAKQANQREPCPAN